MRKLSAILSALALVILCAAMLPADIRAETEENIANTMFNGETSIITSDSESEEDTVTIDSSKYPQSHHNYASNLNESKTFTWPGALSLTITFSMETEVETNYDLLYLYDGTGNLIGEYTGTDAAGLTVTIPGDTFVILLTTDDTVQKYGYSFDSIVAIMGDPVITELSVKTVPAKTEYYLGEAFDVSGLVLEAAYSDGSVQEITEGFTVSGFESAAVGAKNVTFTFENKTAIIRIQVVCGGTCGENVSWKLDGYGNLTISGIGAMYFSDGTAPWSGVADSVKKAVIESGVTSIADTAFSGCASLLSVEIPESVTVISTEAFMDCSSLSSVTVPNGVTVIGDGAFDSCTSLKEIILGQNVATIGAGAFNNCYRLNTVNIPASVTAIDLYAFGGCKALKNVTYCGSTNQWIKITSTIGNEPLTSVQVQYHDWTGGDCATPMTCVYCGVTDTKAGHRIENGICTACQCYGICGSNLTWTLDESGILTITGEGTLADCNYLAPWYSVRKTIKGIVLDERITGIGNYAFFDCTELTNITLPSNVTKIGSFAFHNCSGLNLVSIPKSVTAIDGYAFYCCTALTDVIYCGTEQQWTQITIGENNDSLTNAQLSYHTYDDDSDADCNTCGEIREVTTALPTDTNLKFFGAPGLSFQDYIGMQIMLRNKTITNNGYSNFYVEITQVDFEGNVTTTQTIGTPYGSSYTFFEQQILSWSMTEEVTMTLYGVKNGVTYKGQSFTTSVEALALEKIPSYVSSGDMARAKALVDMLNFGSAVQTSYSHNTTDLPNADLGDLAQYGTTADPKFTAVNDITGKNTIRIYSNNISMQSKVEFQFMVKTTALEGMTIVAKMGDKDIAVSFEEPMAGYTIIRVPCGAAFMRETFTIYITDANGNIQTCTYNVTVEGYAAQQLSGEKAPAMKALLTYGDAVAAI